MGFGPSSHFIQWNCPLFGDGDVIRDVNAGIPASWWPFLLTPLVLSWTALQIPSCSSMLAHVGQDVQREQLAEKMKKSQSSAIMELELLWNQRDSSRIAMETGWRGAGWGLPPFYSSDPPHRPPLDKGDKAAGRAMGIQQNAVTSQTALPLPVKSVEFHLQRLPAPNFFVLPHRRASPAVLSPCFLPACRQVYETGL